MGAGAGRERWPSTSPWPRTAVRRSCRALLRERVLSRLCRKMFGTYRLARPPNNSHGLGLGRPQMRTASDYHGLIISNLFEEERVFFRTSAAKIWKKLWSKFSALRNAGLCRIVRVQLRILFAIMERMTRHKNESFSKNLCEPPFFCCIESRPFAFYDSGTSGPRTSQD